MVVVGELAQRLVPGLREFGVAVAELHAPQPRHPVEQTLALAVGEPDAVGRGNDADALLVERGGVAEGMDVVGGVERLPVAGLIVDGRRHGLNS